MTLDELAALGKRVAERQQLIEARQKLIEAGANQVGLVLEPGSRLGNDLARLPAYVMREVVDAALAKIEAELIKAGLEFEPTLKAATARA